MKIRMKTVAMALLPLVVTSIGCESLNQTQRGGAIGAGAGAAVGAIIGHKTGSTTRGVIVGAVVGGAAGALIGRRMDQQAAVLREELPGAQVSRVGEGIAVTFDSGLLFPHDSDQLQPEARTNLRKLAASLQDNARTEILIVGHTDSTGTDDYNRDLSERRARSAASFLSAEGVSRTRVRTEGRGETEPIETNDSDAGRRQNRRVEIAIVADEQWREEAQRSSGD